MSGENADAWTTVGKLAADFGVTKQAVSQWIRRQGLPVENLGTDARPRYRIPEAALAEWLENRRQTQEPRWRSGCD